MTMDGRSGDFLAEGTSLGEFEIVGEEPLGAGGFGVTYLAHDHSLDRRVAIKEYLPQDWGARGPDGVGPLSAARAKDYEWGLERFLKEARALARLHHAHIVQVYQVFEAWGTAYMVTEYVKGGSLAEALGEGSWTEARVLALLDALTAGLAAVHEAGLVHRDVKPANVMLREDGSPVLIDFGAVRSAAGGRTGSLLPVMTPKYAPIEQYTEKGVLGPWTDVYALGAVAYKALSGREPDEAPERASEDTLRPVAEVASQAVSARLSSAVASALAVGRQDRPQSMADWRGLLGLPPVTGPEKPPPPPPPEPSRRLRLAGAAAVAAVVLAVAGLAWFWGESEDVFRDCAGCPEMVVIPAGEFGMGSPASEAGRYDDEGPLRRVVVGAFALGRREVTWSEYAAFVTATGRGSGDGCFEPIDGELLMNPEMSWREPGFAQHEGHPVVCVTWEDAQAYAAWLSGKTGKSYRLPSESEWEYAARAGTTAARYWGSGADAQCEYANGADAAAKSRFNEWTVAGCDDGAIQTALAGSYEANDFGLFDMLGNVAEWVEDCWHDDYSGAPSDGTAWTVGGDCRVRVLRGGSWGSDPPILRSAARGSAITEFGESVTGFRVARTLD